LENASNIKTAVEAINLIDWPRFFFSNAVWDFFSPCPISCQEVGTLKCTHAT
jgi:hypothetical protein